MDSDTRLILESLFLLLRVAERTPPFDGVARDCGDRADAINKRLREHDAEAAKFNGPRSSVPPRQQPSQGRRLV